MIAPSAVGDAMERLSGVANRTPVHRSRSVDDRVGAKVVFKCENFQRAGAFKFRGAYNAISSLGESERRGGVITHSSGNHAQGVALAAQLLETRAVIVMPHDALPVKRAATVGYGAEIVGCDAHQREAVCQQLVDEHGYTLVHPYDDDQIIAGAGTAAWELFDEAPDLDLLLVPVGGGGLISGTALAAAARAPSCRVVGVEPELGDDANRSFREGAVHTLDRVPDTVADGLRTRHIGERNLEVMLEHVSDMTTVTEDEILEAMRYLWERLKLVVEPSAAVPFAALLSGRQKGERVGVIVSGGNVDLDAVPFRS